MHSAVISRRALVSAAASAGFCLAGWNLHVHHEAYAATPSADCLTVALSVDPDGLDPQRTVAACTFQVTNNLYDTLIRTTPQAELVPGLAESWDVSEDGLTLTFHLRPDLHFCNGHVCDAAAVVRSFERLQGDASPRSALYADYTFEAPDDRTVVATSSHLDVAALTTFVYPWSAIVDVQAADTLRNAPVGTGPYMLDNWAPQQHLTLVRNPWYWREPAHTSTVVLRIMPDMTSQVSSLRTKEIDMALVLPDQMILFEDNPDFRIVQAPMNGIQLMPMNLAHEALGDVRVRRAIACAIDRQLLIDTVWWGYGLPVGSHYPVGLPEYVDTTDYWPYDPDESRRLLQEAGYGSGLTLRMRLPESYPEYVAAGQVIADFLHQVGITCNIEIVEWATWLSEVYNGRDYDLTVVGHTGRLDPYLLLARYASDSGENYFNYKNPHVDELLDAYCSERDPEERCQLVGEIQQTLADEVPAFYIQDPVVSFVTSPRVSGFEMYPIDVYEFRNVVVEG